MQFTEGIIVTILDQDFPGQKGPYIDCSCHVLMLGGHQGEAEPRSEGSDLTTDAELSRVWRLKVPGQEARRVGSVSGPREGLFQALSQLLVGSGHLRRSLACGCITHLCFHLHMAFPCACLSPKFPL